MAVGACCVSIGGGDPTRANPFPPSVFLQDSLHLPHLERYLSLSQIRSLSLTAAPLDDLEIEHPALSLERLQTLPLQLEALTIFVLPALDLDVGLRTDVAWDEVTSSLDPRTVNLVGMPIRLSILLPSIYLPSPTWPNLSLLRLLDCTNDEAIQWACLEGPERNLTIVLGSKGWRRVGTLPIYWSTFEELSRVKRVVVQSSSEERSRRLKEEVQEMWRLKGYPDEEIDRRNALLTYEVVKEGEV